MKRPAMDMVGRSRSGSDVSVDSDEGGRKKSRYGSALPQVHDLLCSFFKSFLTILKT